MTATTPAAQALDHVATLLDQAEATDTLGRRLPERSWTPENQRKFLQYVADGNTAEFSAFMIGLSVGGAYAFRRTARGAAFALGWRAANLIAREAIADQLMERAMKGQSETITRADGSEVTKLRYDNRLAMNLLRRLDRQAEEATGADAAAARVVAGEFDAYLDLVEKDGGPARAGLFLARRSPQTEDARDLEPILSLAAADRFARTGAGTAAEVDIADLDPAQRAGWTAEQWARAEAAGLLALAPPPAPEKPASAPQPPQPVSPVADELDPIWEDDEHGWVTDAPPPEDFDGEEDGEYGDEDYSRTLTEAEEAIWLGPIVRARQARRVEAAAKWRAFLAGRAASSEAPEDAFRRAA
jgi:hypothetical protein